MGLFIAVAGILLATSENGSAAYSKSSTTSSSRKLEFVSLVVPTSGVVVINQFVLVAYAPSCASMLDVTGLQWYWIIDGSDVTINQNLQIGTLLALFTSNAAIVSSGVQILLSAVDVIHAIAIPNLGVKADAIPGRLVNVRFEFEVAGAYHGQCSELCGAMHAFMPLCVVAVPNTISAKLLELQNCTSSRHKRRDG